MAERPVVKNLARALAVLVAGLLTVACQGMDRLERDRVVVAGDAEADDRGTILDTTAGPDYGSGGRLTEEIAQRRVREIMGAPMPRRRRTTYRGSIRRPIVVSIW